MTMNCSNTDYYVIIFSIINFNDFLKETILNYYMFVSD